MTTRSAPILTIACLLLPLLFAAPTLAADDPLLPPPAAPQPEEDPAPLVQVEDFRGTQLGTVVVTGTRVETREVDVPRALTVVKEKRILERRPASVVDALDDQIGLWVEKRTAHTSDLVIRGLSGGNLLALIDGNTLSTFWGEGGFAGDDMYGKIDPEMVERMEVVRGPSSVLYGSNALGGVVNFITKTSPFDYTDGLRRYGAITRVLGGRTPSLIRLHQEFFGATGNLRWIVGGTYWNVGSTRDGGGQVQKPTGGNGQYANAQLNWRLKPDTFLNLTIQQTHNGKVYKYYRPNQDNTNDRLAIAASLELNGIGRRTGLADEMKINLYYQDKRDRRRWFDSTSGQMTKSGLASWETIQAGVQLHKVAGRHDITYGVSFETTAGESPDDEQFTITPVGGTPSKAAPDSDWSSLGAYIQDRWQVNSRFALTASLRVDTLRFATQVDSQYVPAGGLDPKLDEFTDHQLAIVGGLQATVQVARNTEIFGGWSRGFRQFAPHFGVSEHGFGVVVPSQLLDPVTADQFEVGLKHRSQWVTADAAVYYTRFRNFQNIVRGTFQGQDWYDFNQDGVRDPGEDVFVTTGNGKAYLYGVEVSADVNLARVSRRFFGDAWSVNGGFAYNYGQDQTNDIPMRHTHPAWGVAALRYDDPSPRRGLWAELQGKFVGRFDRIPPSRLAGDVGYWEDPQDSTSGMRRTWGLPGYTVVNLRGGMNIGRKLTVVLGIDNVFDKLYRPAHARWDAPGRNIYASLDLEL